MRRFLLALCITLPFAPAMLAHAESHNPADYPLRLHVYGRSETTFYQHRQAEEAKGEGRANLFEGGAPKGIDFQFECDHKLMVSSGWETYPARWKKPNQELVILQPEFGKPGSYDTCHLKVEMKEFAYYMREGKLYSEPPAIFKTWMDKHEYDPEHGKNMPTPSTSAGAKPAAPTGTAVPSVPTDSPQ